jgi:hypothetical protein
MVYKSSITNMATVWKFDAITKKFDRACTWFVSFSKKDKDDVINNNNKT